MRQRLFLIASVLIGAVSLARVQTHTADGVDAFMHGDYQRAADILKPIAEGSLPADHVAEFFMAALYKTGRGVPVDAVRACALYMRASADRVGPKPAHILQRGRRPVLVGVGSLDFVADSGMRTRTARTRTCRSPT